ncbi:helix-turn-helix domain-containing protein [Streptomyces lomondensis]|nr:helix-turn-helix domain-containing protein [Streptomyces lomondensis]MCF0076182.1 helix-turn-helix domain-containing protein [Streptomyces lomondensis]
MDTQNPSVPPHAQARVAGNKHPNRRPHAGGGLTHDNTRHTTRFTVIGNHLTQHPELSLLAIGLACHIQSLPKGARVDIKTLAARFLEGATRIAAALRELEAHGYLRRERHRTPTGRIVTRTISCNQPAAARHRPEAHDHSEARTAAASEQAPPQQREACEESRTHPTRAASGERPPRKPLPDVPRPAYPAPALLQAATDLLADLHRHDPRLLLSACDTAHLAPGVAAWLERDVAPTAVRRALTADLPPEGVRRPAAFLAHRLAAQLPPQAPFRAPAAAPPPAVRHPMRNCDGCDRGFRSPDPTARCRDCRSDLQEAA